MKIENTTIDRVYEFNFLDKIVNKISKNMGILNKLKTFTSSNCQINDPKLIKIILP